MQKLIITGNVGKDAVARNINAQRDVINFTVACNEKWKDQQGVLQTKTTWYNCSYFRPNGQTAIAQYIKKGTSVYIEGTPSAKLYTPTQGGESVATMEVNVNVIELMGSAPAQGGTQQAAPAQVAQPQQHGFQPMSPTQGIQQPNQFAPQDDDLPF